MILKTLADRELGYLAVAPLFVTWVLMQMFRPLMDKTHPWKASSIGFRNWCEHATPLCLDLGWGITISSVCAAGILIYLLIG